MTGQAIETGLSADQARRLPLVGRSGLGRSAPVVPYQYRIVVPCGKNTPDHPDRDVDCRRAQTGCPEGSTGAMWVFRRLLAPGRPPGAWENVGTTCFGDAVPTGTRGLSIESVVAAFRRTPFARPEVSTQPVGNRTLVGLPTYFAAGWSATGVEPGAANRVTLAGVPVAIRPTLVSYEYRFGDGTSSGPTTSAGGTYPDGDITHEYSRSGVYRTQVVATLAGEFSVAGGPFAPIPGTAQVAGPEQPVTVVTAKNRLVTH